MEFASIKPNNITLVSVLSVCSHVGFVDEIQGSTRETLERDSENVT
jgi:hypothetical protein